MKENSSMEWNVEWKIVSMEWENRQNGIWKTRLPFHSTVYHAMLVAFDATCNRPAIMFFCLKLSCFCDKIWMNLFKCYFSVSITLFLFS